jgi:hypothetical protein
MAKPGVGGIPANPNNVNAKGIEKNKFKPARSLIE